MTILYFGEKKLLALIKNIFWQMCLKTPKTQEMYQNYMYM